MQKKLLLVVTALGAMTLAACDQGITSNIVADSLNATMIADFSEGESEEIYPSDGWSNGGGFNAVWTSDNVTYSDGKMKLSIQDEEAEADEVIYPHTAGEARTHKLYGYGDYEVRMKPTNVVGSVSTFFTYTDEWNKVDGVENKHDEIDIEFLGKDTTKVQFNYFVGGQGGHEHMHNLGFDASQEFHNYGFRWAEKSITWFVDGVPVYQVNKDNPAELPSQNGRMIASYWPSSISSWSGTYEGPSDKTCEYEWIKSSGDTIYADGDAPVPIFDSEINWDSISITDLAFSANPTDTGYTVTKADGVTTIAYDQPKAWRNVRAGAPDVVNSNDVISLVLKNNSETESTIRVDVQGENLVGNRDALNEMALVYDTDAKVSTDPEWGGSKLTLKAGEEARLVIKYDVTTDRGLAKNILIFTDSLSEKPAAHQGGNITVKDIKFGSTTGTPIVPPTPTPVDPEPTPTPTPVEDLKLTFTDGAWSTYTVNPAFGTSTASLTVSYEEMEGGHYQNISAPVSPESTDNAFSVKLKNNGSAVTTVRVDVLNDSTILNTSESCTGGHDIGNAIIYGGGSFVSIDADEEVVFTVYFNQSTNAANGVSFFFDSFTYEDTNSYSGNVTISDFAFEVVENPSIDWSSIDALDVAVWSGNEAYSVEKNGTVNTVTYSSASGWACCGAYVASDATDKNIMTITFTNNSEINSNIRLDLQSTIAENKNVPVTSVTSDGDAIRNGNNEINFSVAAGESITLEVTYAASEEDGNINNLMFYIDSMQVDPLAHEGGSISISDIKFALAE